MMQTILLPLDGSPLAEQAIPFAASVARRSSARIILVRAAHSTTLLDVDAADAQHGVISRAERDLEATAERLRADGLDVEVHVTYDTPVPTILSAARLHGASLIVMSTHGRSGLGRMVYGSVADDVLRHAEVPILLVPPLIDRAWAADKPLTILVPLDGSPLAEDALASAGLLAERLGARLHLLQVIEPPRYPLAGDGYAYIPFDDEAERGAAHQYLDGLAARLVADGTPTTVEVVVGLPSLVIPHVAATGHADAIAMATHGRGGLTRLVLGSVASGTLQRIHLPLLLTRPDGQARPVTVPTPATSTPATADASPPATVTLTLSPDEVVLIRHAVESMLLSAHAQDDLSESLRVVLDRLRLAEHGNAPAPMAVAGP